MSWRSRSKENLEAGRRCQEGELFAAAVTRFYYAAYHAALELLEQFGPAPPDSRDGAGYWPHVEVARALGEVCRDCEKLETRYELLRSRRVRADYRLDEVKANQCQTVRATAEDLVADLWRCLDHANLS